MSDIGEPARDLARIQAIAAAYAEWSTAERLALAQALVPWVVMPPAAHNTEPCGVVLFGRQMSRGEVDLLIDRLLAYRAAPTPAPATPDPPTALPPPEQSAAG